MIRDGTQQDVEPVVDLAIESALRYPTSLVPNRERIRSAIQSCLADGYGVVSELGGRVVGALGAVVVPSFWSDRAVAQVLMFYCRESGDGAAMIRGFVEWVHGKIGIKQVMFNLEPTADRRIAEFLRRLGFEGGEYFVLTKGKK